MVTPDEAFVRLRLIGESKCPLRAARSEGVVKVGAGASLKSNISARTLNMASLECVIAKLFGESKTTSV